MGQITEDIHPFKTPGGLQNSVVDGVTVASTTAMPASRALITTVSGTVAVSTIAVPWPGFTGTIKYIPTAAFTGTTGGTETDIVKPVGLAFTAVVGRVLDLSCDGHKWYPSYV